MVCPGRPDLQTDELLLWAWTEQESHACKHHWFWVVNNKLYITVCIIFILNTSENIFLVDLYLKYTGNF